MYHNQEIILLSVIFAYHSSAKQEEHEATTVSPSFSLIFHNPLFKAFPLPAAWGEKSIIFVQAGDWWTYPHFHNIAKKVLVVKLWR